MSGIGKGPLTKLMLRVLKHATTSAGGVVSFQPVSRNGMKQFVTSLRSRGLIRAEGAIYVITEAGREAAKGTQ